MASASSTEANDESAAEKNYKSRFPQSRRKDLFVRKSATMCEAERKASLKCIMDNNGDKSKCWEHFEVYKECKKRKQAAYRQENIDARK